MTFGTNGMKIIQLLYGLVLIKISLKKSITEFGVHTINLPSVFIDFSYYLPP